MWLHVLTTLMFTISCDAGHDLFQVIETSLNVEFGKAKKVITKVIEMIGALE